MGKGKKKCKVFLDINPNFLAPSITLIRASLGVRDESPQALDVHSAAPFSAVLPGSALMFDGSCPRLCLQSFDRGPLR